MADDNGGIDTSAAADALTWAADQGANVASMSFASDGSLGTYFDDAVNYASSYDVSMWAAVGNTDKTSGPDTPPCNYYAVNCVGSSSPYNTVSDFTVYSPSTDVCAPGEYIISEYPDDTYEYLYGTSMATPAVSGLAAALKARNFSYSADDIYYQIVGQTWDLGDSTCGYGKVDFYYAIDGWY